MGTCSEISFLSLKPGMDDLDSTERPMAEFLNDVNRVAFYENYLSSVLEAIR